MAIPDLPARLWRACPPLEGLPASHGPASILRSRATAEDGRLSRGPGFILSPFSNSREYENGFSSNLKNPRVTCIVVIV